VKGRLKHLAHQDERTMYQGERGLPHDYLVRQLENSDVRMPLE